MNNYFKHIACVNLKRRPDKWAQCDAEFKKNNIDVERFDAVDGESITDYNGTLSLGYVGCVLSHLELIKKARDKGYESILIFEDDVVFVDNVNEVFNEVIGQVPDDWDMLYLGGNHNNSEKVMVAPNVRKIDNTYTTHAYALKNTIYDSVIDRLGKMYPEVDVILAEVQKTCNAYCFSPVLAWQRAGVSDIWNVYVDYDFLRNNDGNTK